MYHLTIEEEFAAAHNLLNYHGDCEKLHGHNWKVEVTVGARDLDNAGLGLDFRVLKDETRKLLKELDHKYLNELEAFHNMSPSSENIARYLFERLETALAAWPVEVERVGVWESGRARAEYTRD